MQVSKAGFCFLLKTKEKAGDAKPWAGGCASLKPDLNLSQDAQNIGCFVLLPPLLINSFRKNSVS
jgi:hypothetical protein